MYMYMYIYPMYLLTHCFLFVVGKCILKLQNWQKIRSYDVALQATVVHCG